MIQPRIAVLKDGRELLIRQAEPDDAEPILRYLEQVGGETDFLTFGPGEFAVTVEEERQFLRGLLENDRDFVLTGVVDGRHVAGSSIRFGPRPRVRHVGVLGVSALSAFWGTGAGPFMCEAAFAVAGERGARKINLEVRSDNARAIRLYEKLGFVHEGVSRRAFLVRGVFHANVLMGLDID